LLNEGVKSGHTTATENANLQALLAQQSALDKQQADLVAHQNDIESNLQQALAQQLNVVPALPSKSPSSPKTLRNVGLGLLVLALVGVLASYIVALRRRRFAGRHEPENLYQAPLLGDVPRLQAENITSALPVVTNPISAAAESFRFLAASLGTVQPAHEHLPVIVTSATSGSGKTTMSANVATALAARGWRVLAVDADFIRRGLSTLLLETDGMQGPGLSEVLSGEVNVETAARPATIEQGTLSGELSVLTPGASGDLLPSLVASSGSEEFRTKICMPYDAVIVDGPPLAGVAFAADLASLVGNIIVVVNHDDLVGPQMDFVDQLHATSGQIIGYIYNRAPLRKGLASYYQYQYQSAGGPGHAAQSPNQARRPAPAIPASVSTAARVADPTASDVATSEDEEVARWAVTPSAIAEPANPRTAGGSDRTESSRDVRAPG
jgi:Mrp family chromosome partitioning ATPase